MVVLPSLSCCHHFRPRLRFNSFVDNARVTKLDTYLLIILPISCVLLFVIQKLMRHFVLLGLLDDNISPPTVRMNEQKKCQDTF
jgi:hypothetical protein